MFRPNRIGTPKIYQEANYAEINDYDVVANNVTSDIWQVNNINATPQLDFGRNAMKFSGSESIPAQTLRFGICQLVTITAPIDGDTVGIELNGAIVSQVPADIIVVPFFAKVDAWTSNLMGNVTLQPNPMIFNAITQKSAGYLNTAYTQSVIKQGITGQAVAGLHAHGFLFYQPANAWNWVHWEVDFSVRQLNDQQEVGYRDTLR